ncbi:plasmid stabilization system [Treponema primitia ZAS-2]|uniref:Plasmid stabilization system n=1 Tax=Treponema primitia (strain ATCC BAA-887 / DSM 12427 / ZAS-2) TaxID=545694 RepID=F5YRI9_TREPZ|nr:type II toxin-antitoxin system RelE/ParE family toxin [Treponema primitia]AEF84169.1 plasmid stabilization system [Treponema primitia ZAS-2]
MKTHEVIIHPKANDRMYEHFQFLARVSVQGAESLLDKLIDDIQSLEFMPERYPWLERDYLPKRKYRYMLSAKRYRIVYQVIENTVFVEDIQDCRQDDDKNRV